MTKSEETVNAAGVLGLLLGLIAMTVVGLVFFHLVTAAMIVAIFVGGLWVSVALMYLFEAIAGRKNR